MMRRSSGPTKAEFAAVRGNAAVFAEKVLRRHLWSKQREVLEAISTHQRVAVASCHSIGKSFLATTALLWFAYTRKPAVVITTAPTWTQVENIIWRYAGREFERLPPDLRDLGTLHKTRLELAADHYAFGLSTDRADRFQGYHSPHIMLIVDEAAGVDEQIYEAAATLGAGGEYRELLIGNPTNGEGKFFRAFHNPALEYHCLRIDALETPNFTDEPCPVEVARELIQPSQVKQWEADWGPDSPAFLSRVHAQFPSADELSVIAPLSWWEAATRRPPIKLSDRDIAQIGVDVARFGADRSCIVERVGTDLRGIVSFQGVDTVTLANAVCDRAEDLAKREPNRPVRVCIDVTGVGSGVVDQCQRRAGGRVSYHGVNFGGAARDAGRFLNLRAEMYWGLRELLRRGNNDPDLAVSATGPEVDRLGSQLASIRYVYNSRDKVQVESKEEMRKREMPSPDEADAAVLAFCSIGEQRRAIRLVDPVRI